MLRAEVISKLSPQDRLIEEWRVLADACEQATVFQTPDWLATWWSAVGGRGRGRSLRIVAIRDGDELVGAAPLMSAPWYGLPIRRLCFLGAGVTDYNDVLAAPGRSEEVCASLFTHLAQQANWDVLDFRELREGGLLRRCPPQTSTGLTYSDWPLEACPFVKLPDSGSPDERWTALLSGYSRKTRSNIGYTERSLQRAFRVDMRVVEDEAEIQESFAALFELHRRRWNRRWLPGVFSSERVRAFHVEAARRLLRSGCLRLHVLRLDDEIQAVLYGLVYHGRASYYQGGFEPELARYSLGTVLIANAVRTAVHEGCGIFDFLRGNEEYKRRWSQGQAATNIRRIVGRSGSPQLAFAERIHAVESRIETALKQRFAGGIVHRAARRSGTAPTD